MVETQRNGLSWERLDPADAPAGAGICVSGGGLRAAMFGLGVLQVLQQRRGLLFGPQSARWLSAVSGGSYIAAAYAASSRQLASRAAEQTQAPFADGSPEEQHVLTHGRYLVTPMPWAAMQLVGVVALNLLGMVALFVWAGVMLNDFAIVSEWVGLYDVGQRIPAPAAVLGLCLGFYVLVRGLYSGRRVPRLVAPLAGFALVVVTVGRSLDALAAHYAASPALAWLSFAGGGLGLMVFSGAVSAVLTRAGVHGVAAAAANWAQVVSVRLTLLAVLVLSAVACRPEFRRWFDEDSLTGLVLFFVVLAVPLLVGTLMGRYTLHRQYRDRAQSCFGVLRSLDADGVSVPSQPLLLSQLAGGPYPDLLICATANVSNVDAHGKRRAFAPFVFASDVCGVPGSDTAWLPTTQLELGRLPRPGGKEPVVTLGTAVATTGAAVSPSMGRFTLPSMRPLLAAFNIRFGRWLPNVFHSGRRDFVNRQTEPCSFNNDTRLTAAYDELVPEMLGIANTDMYVSDGGHYDNLGLLALIRARCAEIWCIDASPDPDGSAVELVRVLAVATSELGVTHDLDVNAFRTSTRGTFPVLHVSGTITYPGGQPCTVRVIKLGLDSESPDDQVRYAQTEPPFPHHPTWRQWFSQERSVAYRDAGRHAANQCLDSLMA